MKTLVNNTDNEHAIINSMVFTKMENGAPIFVEGTGGKAKTHNCVSTVVIYIGKPNGKVIAITLSPDFIDKIAKEIRAVKLAESEPYFPDC